MISLLSASNALAHEIEMADGLRSEGKIYVVVIVVAVVVIGLFAYLFYLDNRITASEKTGSKK